MLAAGLVIFPPITALVGVLAAVIKNVPPSITVVPSRQAFSDFRMGSIPAASGRKMKFAGTTVLRLENGRIAEELGQEDALSAMLQLGLICLPELELAQARPSGPLPHGWNNMSGSWETRR